MCTSWLDGHLKLTSHCCIQRSQRTWPRMPLQWKREWDRAQDSESASANVRVKWCERWEVPYTWRVWCSWENELKRSDWQMRLVVSNNVFCFWAPSDYPVYLSCVTLTKEIANNLTSIIFFRYTRNPCPFYIRRCSRVLCVIAQIIMRASKISFPRIQNC